MKVAKPTTSACISLDQRQRAPPARTSAKVTCSRGSPTGAKPGRDAPRAHRRPVSNGTPSLRRRNGGSSPSRHQQQESNRTCLGLPSSMCLTLTGFPNSRRRWPCTIPRGIQMPPRCFSICCTAPREPSPISRHWDKPRVRDEMRWAQWGCTLQEAVFYVLEIALFRQGQQLES